MLKLFSRMEKTRSYVIIAFALLMGLSLVFFYAPSQNSAVSTSAMTREVVARVRGDSITVGELEDLKAGYRRMFGGQFNAAQFGGDRRMLDGLIRTRIVAQEAARLGLAPSDGEVRDAVIERYTNPQTGQFVGFERYKQLVLSQYGSVERAEQQIRDALAEEKLRAFVTAGASVSEEEVQQEWERKNTKFDLLYVPVLPTDLARQVTPTDEELARYYDAHRDEFKIDVPQKNIRYLFVSQSKAGERAQISDEELRREFDSLRPENKIAGVRVQQIVLKVAAQELENEVLNTATGLVAGIRGDDLKAPEEKFAELALGRSEDPATARAGGWLPRPVRKNPNPSQAGDIYQNAIDLQPGQVSDPFFDKKSSAFYIFRRGEQIDKTFEEAKQELLVSLRNRRGYAAAAQLAQRAAERLKETKNHEQVARELAAEANMGPAEMVRETGFIKPGDEVKDIGSSPQFEDAIAPLENPQDVGERVSIRDGFAIPMLLEKRDPRVPELAEVREQVVEKVKGEKAQAQVEAAARELTAANTPDELKAIAERLGLRPQETKEYTLGTPLGVAGTSASADEAVYALRPGNVTKTPIKIEQTYVVAAAKGRTDADLAKFGAERDKLIGDALEERRMQVFDDYMTSVRARLDREGDIKVYDDVLAKVSALETPNVATPRSSLGGTSAPVPVVPE